MGTHYNGKPESMAVLDAWIKITRATRSVSRQIKPSVENEDLTMAQFGVMEILLHLGPQNQRTIGSKLLWSPGNVVKVVDNLERDGLVRRKSDPRDRRSQIIDLTPKGRKKIEKVFSNHLIALESAFSVLDRKEISQLGHLCKKLGTGEKKIKGNSNE